jgi:hypothetical protein
MRKADSGVVVAKVAELMLSFSSDELFRSDCFTDKEKTLRKE